jgi:CBS domain-containing protein
MTDTATTSPATRATRVRDVMTPEVTTLDAAATLREAADLFAAEGISGAPVTQGDEVVGVLSVRDVLDFAASLPPGPGEASQAPGEDDEELDYGDEGTRFFVDLWDEAPADVLARLEASEMGGWDVLAEHEVSEIMTRKVISVSPEATIREVARELLSHRIHRIVVMEDDHLAGLVTTTDLVRHLAEQG